MYDPGMNNIDKKKELWDRLENEPETAYRAFETYRNLPSAERTVIAAYRHHTGNPDAVKSSDTYSGWSPGSLGASVLLLTTPTSTESARGA
jgi:hypothetical protein